jgi:hypothetical protein
MSTGPQELDTSPEAPGWQPADHPQRPSVRWLSPSQLWRTALEVASSTFIARFADQRKSEASDPKNGYDLDPTLRRLAGERDVFIDYVADTGDGFNATYTVACSVAGASNVVDPPDPQASPAVSGCSSCTGRSTAGQLLLLGGDEVYPVPSVQEFDERLKNVFQAAAKAGQLPAERYVAAIPGNHDWYDGLVTFRRNFCESWVHYSTSAEFVEQLPDVEHLEKVAGWRTFQSRSYFAVQLPHHWWLWGIDIQLDAPIDAAQLDYFRLAADELDKDPDARVVIATARPSWLDPDHENDMQVLSNRQNLAWFIHRMLATDKFHPDHPDVDLGIARLRLVLAGDLHHYARYTPCAKAQSEPAPPPTPSGEDLPTMPMAVNETAAAEAKNTVDDQVDARANENAEGMPEFGPRLFAPELVTCGGGGAFMSSTHHLQKTINPFWDPDRGLTTWDQTYGGKVRFPTEAMSKHLRRRVFTAAFLNDNLAVFCATLYGLMLWALGSSVDDNGGWLFARLPSSSEIELGGPGLAELITILPFLVAVVALFGLLSVFAKHGSDGHRRKAAAAASLHTAAHVALVVAAAGPLGWLARRLEHSDLTEIWQSLSAIFGLAAYLILLGYVGAVVLSTYLFLSDVVGIHKTECASSFRHEGYKSHLRIHVTPDALHVRAIGIRDVPSFAGSFTPPPGKKPKAEEIDAFVIPRDATEPFASITDLDFD